MTDSDTYRRRAEALLHQATLAANMAERGRLIDEAIHWHNLAMDADGHTHGRLNDNLDLEDGDQRELSGG